ncbi:MAG: hypothetical protein IRY89_02035 [Pseudolabrys sp.]|nr:hypothetical protein [Pseudolabrys sp.]
MPATISRIGSITSLDHLNERIDAFAHLYNHDRSPGALGGRTSAEYLTLASQETPLSQMD